MSEHERRVDDREGGAAARQDAHRKQRRRAGLATTARHLAGTGGFCYGALRVARTYAEAGYICVTPDLVGHANAFRARVPLPMVPIDADLAALVSARATARAAARPLRPRSTRL